MKILFCGEGFPDARERLRRLLPDDEILAFPVADLPAHIADADIIVPLVTRIDEAFICKGTFGLIQQYGVGLDPVDINAATRNGVMVARIPSEVSGNAASVAEHAILFLLMLSRRWNKIARLQAQAAPSVWGTPTGQALKGKTVCIVGLGGVGRELVRRLSCFLPRITVVDDRPGRTVPGVEIARSWSLGQLREAVGEADYVILCINYTPDRFHLIGSEEIAAMKPGAYLINVARGGLLDENALLAGLKSGHVSGAGLDVFWQEPVDMTHPIFSENVIATPHIGGVTDISYDGIASAFAENVKRYKAGEQPLYLVRTVAHSRRTRPPESGLP